ncbi:MAG TPA: hypothetical protein VFC19_16390, partial [Candidatus Limnocylindrales bacterium]|nr:hypothetical protein [Candidatus Limnocylindrales bacterium]
MTDYEWPPDEIAGPPEEGKPQGKLASAKPSGAPVAGVPIPVGPPQPGIPMPGPQPVGDPGQHPGQTPGQNHGLPPPPPGQQAPIPVATAPIPVRPHTPPVPVTPNSGQVGPPPAPSGPPAPHPMQVPPPGIQPSINTQGGPPPTPHPMQAQPLPPSASGSAKPLPQSQPTSVFPVVPKHTPQHAAPAAPSPITQQPPHMPPSPSAPPTVPGQPFTPPAGPIPMTEEVYLPTAEEFARRRAQRPPDPVAHMGIQAALRKSTFGLVSLPPGQREQEIRRQTDVIRRNFGGLRQITVVNPKGGAGKTCAVLLLAMTFGRKRGGYVLAWDNNETQGTLGMRSQQDFHSRTVRDLMRDLHQFQGVNSRIGDLSQYVRSQGDGMFEVLASDESATAGEMLTANAFAEIREVVSRFYKLIMVDTGNNVRAENWQAAIDATDQLVVTMSGRNDSAETAARMLDHLEQTGRQRLVRQAVSIVSMPPSRKELDVPAIQRHFAARTRSVLMAPYERMLDSGEPIDYARLSQESQDAWLAIAAAVAEGL